MMVCLWQVDILQLSAAHPRKYYQGLRFKVVNSVSLKLGKMHSNLSDLFLVTGNYHALSIFKNNNSAI